MLAPRHEAVAVLPRAYRTPVHLATASGRLDETTRLLNWLASQGVCQPRRRSAPITARHTSLHRRYVLDEHGTVVGERSPGTRRRAAQAIIDLLNYGELFTADRPDPGLRPWGGATATAIAEMPSGRAMNKTPPLSDDVLRPMLAAALYLTSAIGPHAVILNQQVREADRQWGRSGPGEFARHAARARRRDHPAAGPLPARRQPAAHAPRLPGQRAARRRVAARRPPAPGRAEHAGPPGRHQPVQPPVAHRTPGSHRGSRRRRSASRRCSPATGRSSTALTDRARCPGPRPCTSSRPSRWPASSAPRRRP